MAKPDKTDKPEDAQTDKVGKTDEIIDAEIIDEASPPMQESDPPTDSPEQALELEEPGSEPDSDEENAVEDSTAGPDTDVSDVDPASDGSENEVTPDEDAADPVEEAEASDADAEDSSDDADKPDGPEDSAEPAPDPEPVVAAEPVPAPAEKPRGVFVPLVLGGVVAAGLGFGAASYLGTQGILFGANSDDAIAELTAKLDQQSDMLAGLQSAQQDIAASASQANAGLSAVGDASARTAALSQRVEELGGKLQTLEGRLIETEKRPMSQGASSAAIEAYEREVEQLRALVSEQLAEAEQLKATSTRTAQATLAQAALTRVVSAVDSGVPYRGALTELASVTGVAIPAALSDHADDGVATSMALADGFPEVARLALADARKQEKGAVGGGHFSLFLKSQLGARSTEPKEGDDADAILSRAEAALREGRLAASLAELDALPETSQALMANWRALAETRLAALAAVDALAQTLTSN